MASELLITIGILLFCAIIGGIIATRLKQPAVIGLLLIGAIIGPHALNLVKDSSTLEIVSELGAVLLLFTIGLEFVIPKLMKIGFKAFLLSFLKTGLVFFITFTLLSLFGFSSDVALIFGVILSFSSTVVIVKILESKNLYDRQEMPLLMAVLIFEDIFSIFVLTFLSTTGSSVGFIPKIEGLIISMTVLMVAYLIAAKFSRGILNWMMNSSSEDIMLYIALGMCAAFSYLAFILNLSPAIGAFLAGSIIGSMPDVKKFHHSIKPYSGVFVALFFICIGTMVKFSVVRNSIPFLMLLVAIVIITRFIGVGLVGYFFANFKKEQIIFSTITMFAASEFSLIVAKAAAPLYPGIDILSISSALVFVTAIIFSLLISYYEHVYKAVDGVVPREWKNSSGGLADYIRLSFDEMDTENMHSKRLKKNLSRAFLLFMFLLLTVIGWRKVSGVFDSNNVLIAYTAYALVIGLIGFVSYSIYLKLKVVYNTVVFILSNLTVSRSTNKSRRLLNNMLIMLLLLFMIIITPIIITMLNVPVFALILVIPLVLAIFMYYWRTTRLLNNFHSTRTIFPQYRKVSTPSPHMDNDSDIANA